MRSGADSSNFDIDISFDSDEFEEEEVDTTDSDDQYEEEEEEEEEDDDDDDDDHIDLKIDDNDVLVEDSRNTDIDINTEYNSARKHKRHIQSKKYWVLYLVLISKRVVIQSK